MTANDAASWLMVALSVAMGIAAGRWRDRAKRYEQALKLAQGLLAMNRSDYAIYHIRDALERR